MIAILNLFLILALIREKVMKKNFKPIIIKNKDIKKKKNFQKINSFCYERLSYEQQFKIWRSGLKALCFKVYFDLNKKKNNHRIKKVNKKRKSFQKEKEEESHRIKKKNKRKGCSKRRRKSKNKFDNSELNNNDNKFNYDYFLEKIDNSDGSKCRSNGEIKNIDYLNKHYTYIYKYKDNDESIIFRNKINFNFYFFYFLI